MPLRWPSPVGAFFAMTSLLNRLLRCPRGVPDPADVKPNRHAPDRSYGDAVLAGPDGRVILDAYQVKVGMGLAPPARRHDAGEGQDEISRGAGAEQRSRSADRVHA